MKIVKSKGFTLIELLIAMAILAILVTGLIVTLNPFAQIQKANDARRKADIAQIQKALETYYQDNGVYPSSADYKINAIDWGDPWIPYMGNLPKDPDSSKQYAYFVPPAFNGQTYYLYASLDRETDSQVCGGGTDCQSVPDSNICGGSVCNYGASSPDVAVAQNVPTIPLPAPTSTPEPIPTPTPMPGLVGWWKMNGNADDSSGNGNNGIVTGATLTTDRKGRNNKAYSFDGTDDYVDIPDSASLRIATTISGAFWIKLPSSPTGTGQFFIREADSGNGDYWVKGSIGGVWGIFAAGGNGAVNGTTTIQADTWYHLAFAYQTNNLQLYVNGATEGTPDTSVIAPQGITGKPLRFGGGYPVSGPTSFRTAIMDDVRVYNRALSTAEVTALYKE